MALPQLLALAEAKAWLNIDASDASDDDRVGEAALAASALVASELDFDPSFGEATERHLGQQTRLLFPRRPRTTAVASLLEEESGEALAALFDARAVRRADGRPFARDRHYLLTYTAGYDPASAEGVAIKQACRYALQACYGARYLDPNLSGESQGRAFSGSYAPGGPGMLPQAARALLQPLKRLF